MSDSTLDLDHPRQPRSLALPIAFGVVCVLATASFLANVIAFALFQEDESRRTRLAALESQVPQLDAEKSRLSAMIETYDARVQRAEIDLNSAKADTSRTQAALDRAVAAPDSLPAASKKMVLSRIEGFQVRAVLSPGAKAIGMYEGATVEQTKAACRNGGLRADDGARAILLVVASLSGSSSAGVTGQLRVEIVERWRVPGTDLAWPVTVVYEEKAIATVGSQPVDEINDAIADLVNHIADARD